MAERASYFNEREHQICLVARMVEDARTYWVAGGGSQVSRAYGTTAGKRSAITHGAIATMRILRSW